jgi:predicted metal-dependent RNase
MNLYYQMLLDMLLLMPLLNVFFSNFQRPVQSTHPTLDVHILVLSDKYQILQ